MYRPSSSSYVVLPKQPRVIDGGYGNFSSTQKSTHPANKITVGKHIVIIDSRQRNCEAYPSPNRYRMPLGDAYKNISAVELKGVILPKTSYNIHTSNNYIDFAIGDGVTFIHVKNVGSGYQSTPTVTIDPPHGSGTQATATAIMGNNGTVIGIDIVNSGSGYSSSKPPIVTISSPPNSTYAIQAVATCTVGTNYTAELRPGNYVIGGNPTPGTSDVPSDLLLEIQNAMNYAVNGGNYNPTSTSPFAVRIVNQYPTLYATAGSPDAAPSNSCLFNRIQVTNINSDPWELLWCSGPNSTRNARRLMGFPWVDSTKYVVTTNVDTTNGTLIPGGTTLRGEYDYDLTDDPKYSILSFWADESESFERIQSSLVGGINRAFATLVYDANLPDNLTDISSGTDGSIEVVDGNKYLVGDAGKGTFWSAQGYTKPLKGFDFDKKYLPFNPPLGKMAYLNVEFSKYGKTSGGTPELYDFQGRDHMLILELTSGDQAGLIDS